MFCLLGILTNLFIDPTENFTAIGLDFEKYIFC